MEGPVAGPLVQRSYLMELPVELQAMIASQFLLTCLEERTPPKKWLAVRLVCWRLYALCFEALLEHAGTTVHFFNGLLSEQQWSWYGQPKSSLMESVSDDILFSKVRKLRVHVMLGPGPEARVADGTVVEYYCEVLTRGVAKLIKSARRLEQITVVVHVKECVDETFMWSAVSPLTESIIKGSDGFIELYSLYINGFLTVECVERNIDRRAVMVYPSNTESWVNVDGGSMDEYCKRDKTVSWRVM
jgi:hypothetical protein